MSLRMFGSIAICCILFICGCKRSTPGPVSVTVGTGSYVTKNASAWYAFRSNDVFLVVWLDTPAQYSNSSAPDRVLVAIQPGNSKSIAVDYSDGNVQIDGNSYALRNGGMFLVHSKETPARIVQLSRHAPYSSNAALSVIDATREDADVRGFIAAAGATTAPSTNPTR